MNTLPRLASLLAALLLVAIPAGARSPEETLIAYVAAVQRDGLAAAVDFIHPEELAAFRAGVEPEIAKRVKSSRTRQRFEMFADPYNVKQIRPFKDDRDFAVVFIKWMSTSGVAAVSTFENAKVTPLGYVTEGELRHVVARFVFTGKERSTETVAVSSMKMDGAQPMLLLLPELKQVADMVRQVR